MSVFLLIVVLLALILVHEFGHFVVAKLLRMRVDEFGVGYPPRLWGFRRGETEYTVNALPFGGFVRIFGEDIAEGGIHTEHDRSFAGKSRLAQTAVLVAGIGMNLVFAWLLISVTFGLGMPRVLEQSELGAAKNAAVTVISVLPGSPASRAGLLSGDTITRVFAENGTSFSGVDSEAFTAFVAGDTAKEALTFDLMRDGKEVLLSVVPQEGVIESEPARVALGVSVASIGIPAIPWWQLPIEGAKATWDVTVQTAVGLVGFFTSILTMTANFSQISGPVGIASAVGAAGQAGLASLLFLTAVISVNLALINLLPIPALDGGRLLFVIVEAITRKRIRPSIASAVNTAGFALLVLLMVVVTAHDIWKLVG